MSVLAEIFANALSAFACVSARALFVLIGLMTVIAAVIVYGLVT